MAIYHNSTKIIGRSNGRSAVGASAYRSGEKLYNEYDDTAYDFTKKSGVVYSEIMICENAPQEFHNREKLWNEVEKIESSKNSQLAREVEVALPKELNREEQINLVRSYVKDNFVNNGMCADVNIHDKGDGNPHAHIMLTMRPIKENGEWGAKQEKLYLLKKQGEKDIYMNSEIAKEKIKNEGYEKVKRGKSYKTKSVDLTNWNTKEFLQSYRKDWADKINEQLNEKGINERVDHRSYKEQGIEKEPTIHEGYIARKMEKRGEVSDRMEINRQIKEDNKKINSINADMEKLKEIKKQFEINKQKINEKSEINNMEKLKNERKILNEKYQEINKKYNMCNEYKKNSDLIKEYKNKIESEKQYKKNLGLFKLSEKKNIDDRISKLNTVISKIENNISFIKNQLFPSGGSVPMTKTEMLEEMQKIEMQRINIENQLKQNENEIRQEQERAVKEQLEKDKIQKELQEEEQKKNKYSEVREREREGRPKEDLPEEQKQLIEQARKTYINVKIEMIKDPNNKELQKIAEGLKNILDKYKEPTKAINKVHTQNKNIGIER